MSKLPAIAWVCITVVVLAILTSITVLSALGADTTEIRTMVNTFANLGGLLLGSVGALTGSYAAVNSKKAADQTNGQLDARMTRAVRTANIEQDARDEAR